MAKLNKLHDDHLEATAGGKGWFRKALGSAKKAGRNFIKSNKKELSGIVKGIGKGIEDGDSFKSITSTAGKGLKTTGRKYAVNQALNYIDQE